MPILNEAEAVWHGNLKEGNGTLHLRDGAHHWPYTFASRFQNGEGSNPEELIAAALAGCYSMALSHGLDQAGYTPTSVHSEAQVVLDQDPNGGFHMPEIRLTTTAVVPGIDEATFQEQAQAAKVGCPVSKLYQGAEILLTARLRDGA